MRPPRAAAHPRPPPLPAGSPAIALEVLTLLREAGLRPAANPAFNPQRRPIIVPKDHLRWTAARIDPVSGAVSSLKMKVDAQEPAANIICRCEKVTEAEIADACSRSLPCASTQAVRKRTRAGMGHCQAEFCEERVKAVIARARASPHASPAEVPGRPWPASSCLPARWLTEEQRAAIRAMG